MTERSVPLYGGTEIETRVRWSAVLRGCFPHPVGQGDTEEEAIADLRRQLDKLT